MYSAHAEGHSPKQYNLPHTFLPKTQTMMLLVRTVLDPLSNYIKLISAQLMQELRKHMTLIRKACQTTLNTGAPATASNNMFAPKEYAASQCTCTALCQGQQAVGLLSTDVLSQ